MTFKEVAGFPFKRFVKGKSTFPCVEDDGPSTYQIRHNESGEEIRKFYEETVNSSYSSGTSDLHGKEKNKLPDKRKKPHRLQLPTADLTNRLLASAEQGDTKTVLECLEAGCSVHSRDSFGWTALMSAVCAGSLSVVDILLKAGANVKARNHKKQTAVDLARIKKHTSIEKQLLGLDMSSAVEQSQPTCSRTEETCELCGVTYTDKKSHLTSIVHLLDRQKGEPVIPVNNYVIPETNVGYQLMVKSGWDENDGLGPEGTGKKYPVKTLLKADRKGVGASKKEKARVTHFGPGDVKAVQLRGRSVCEIKPTKSKKDLLRSERLAKRKEVAFRREFM